MAAPDPLKAMRVPGRLVASPTTNPPTDAFPHGGTELGLVRDVVLRRKGRYFENEAEEFGGEPGEILYMGEDWFLVFALRGLDPAMVQRVFPNTTADANSGFRAITHPNTTRREGSGLSSSAIPLLFVPNNRLDHPAVFFRAAIPVLADEVEMQLGRAKEMVPVVVFRPLRDATTPAESVQVRLMENIDLT